MRSDDNILAGKSEEDKQEEIQIKQKQERIVRSLCLSAEMLAFQAGNIPVAVIIVNKSGKIFLQKVFNGNDRLQLNTAVDRAMDALKQEARDVVYGVSAIRAGYFLAVRARSITLEQENILAFKLAAIASLHF